MRTSNHGFTLAELLISIAVLALLVLLVSSLVNSAAKITTLGNKRMDADSQARQLLDRMAVDLAQMVKRQDVDYYLKSPSNTQTGGNDQIAFYSTVTGYYPASGYQSPASLVAYRVNSNSNKLERMGKGLEWNGYSSSYIPIVFGAGVISSNWPAATSGSTADSDYEVFGPQVFRFEYYYLVKNVLAGTNVLTSTPWDTNAGHTSVTGMQDVAAVVVDIAVVDPKSKVLLTNSQITTLAGQLADYADGMVPGQLLGQWQSTLNANTSLPRPAISSIRLYERYFYLSPPTL